MTSAMPKDTRTSSLTSFPLVLTFSFPIRGQEQTQARDAKTGNVFNTQADTIDFHFIASDSRSPQCIDNQASHRNGLFGGKAQAKKFIYFIDTDTSCNLYAAIGSLQNLWL
jgi:hypothetical protein